MDLPQDTHEPNQTQTRHNHQDSAAKVSELNSGMQKIHTMNLLEGGLLCSQPEAIPGEYKSETVVDYSTPRSPSVNLIHNNIPTRDCPRLPVQRRYVVLENVGK